MTRSPRSRAARRSRRWPRPSRPTPRRRPAATSAGSTAPRPRTPTGRPPSSSSTPNGLTDVILGADGTYRIGRVTEIAPAQVDRTWDQKLADAKISLAAYRAAIAQRGRPDRARRQDRRRRQRGRPAEAGPGALHQGAGRPRPTASLKVRHILYSPKDDPQRRRRRSRTTDPAWTEAAARGAGGLRQDQGRPQAVRHHRPGRERRDPGPRRRRDRRQAAVLRRRRATIDAAFAAAIFKDGLKPGRPPRAVQELVRLARRPGHVRPAGQRPDDEAQGPGATAGTRLRPARPRQLRRPEGRQGRRHRLGRQGPARRPADGDDPRDAGRLAHRHHRRHRATACTCSRSRPRRPPTPDADQLDDDQGRRLRQLVRRQEGRGHDHPRPPRAA